MAAGGRELRGRIRGLRSRARRTPIEPPGPDPLRWEAVVPGSILFIQAHVFRVGEVLIVGDSHTLICGAHQAYPECDVDALPGRNSAEALQILDRDLRKRHRVVVFEISTNDIADPDAFAFNLRLLAERIGERKLVLVNCWRRDGANSHEEVNRVLAEFATERPDSTWLVDWEGHIERHPRPLDPGTDRVHFSISAYEGRIELVRGAIEEALAASR